MGEPPPAIASLAEAFDSGFSSAGFEHVEAAGAVVMQEPVNRPDGVRDCAFLDPSGNMLRFAQTGQAG